MNEADKNIDRATIIMGILLAIMVALSIYDAVVNAPEEVPIIIKQTSSMITTEYFTNVSDLLYVLSNDNCEIYTK